jgi:hypothetical protein
VNVSKWTVALAIAVALMTALVLTGGVRAQTNTPSPADVTSTYQCPMGGAMLGFGQHRGGGGGMGPGAGMRMGATASLVTVAAEKLGMTVDELAAELRAGKTIEELAQAKGVAVQEIVDTVLALRAERLKALVDAGTITQAQADAMLAQMKTQLQERVAEPFEPRGGMNPGQGPGRGPGRGGSRP